MTTSTFCIHLNKREECPNPVCNTGGEAMSRNRVINVDLSITVSGHWTVKVTREYFRDSAVERYADLPSFAPDYPSGNLEGLRTNVLTAGTLWEAFDKAHAIATETLMDNRRKRESSDPVHGPTREGFGQ